jgi:hypothetical protein
MKHIPKQQWMGCAVATAAMLADRSYDEVAAHWPDLDEARMRSPRELCGLLEAVTDTEWRFSPCWHPQPKVREFLPPAWPVAVWIQDSALRPCFGLWIVIKDEVIHDPGEWTAHAVSSYPRRDWLVTLVAQPVRPEELARIRKQKSMQGLRNLVQPWVSRTRPRT